MLSIGILFSELAHDHPSFFERVWPLLIVLVVALIGGILLLRDRKSLPVDEDDDDHV
jgi:hypothetical protein